MYDLREIKIFKRKGGGNRLGRMRRIIYFWNKGNRIQKGKQKNKAIGNSEKQPYFLSPIGVESGKILPNSPTCFARAKEKR